jgi:hypothetical protein
MADSLGAVSYGVFRAADSVAERCSKWPNGPNNESYLPVADDDTLDSLHFVLGTLPAGNKKRLNGRGGVYYARRKADNPTKHTRHWSTNLREFVRLHAFALSSFLRRTTFS